MDFSDIVTLCWLPGSEIIRNKSWLLKSHMTDAQCVKFPNVRQWGIRHFDHSITQETNIFTWCCWRTPILMLCTLYGSMQSATCSGNTLSAMSNAFCTLMNWVSCYWVQLKTDCTGCSNTSKLEMTRINLTIDSHWCQDILASSTSLNRSIH